MSEFMNFALLLLILIDWAFTQLTFRVINKVHNHSFMTYGSIIDAMLAIRLLVDDWFIQC